MTANATATRGTDPTVHPTAGFAQVPTDLIRDATLPDPAFRLLAEVRSYAWEAIGSQCTASQARIAADLGWSVAKVRRWTKVLVGRGLVQCTSHGRTLHLAPRCATSGVSDGAPVRDQMVHQCATNKTKGNRRSEAVVAQRKTNQGSGGGTDAAAGPARPTTTRKKAHPNRLAFLATLADERGEPVPDCTYNDEAQGHIDRLKEMPKQNAGAGDPDRVYDRPEDYDGCHSYGDYLDRHGHVAEWQLMEYEEFQAAIAPPDSVRCQYCGHYFPEDEVDALDNCRDCANKHRGWMGEEYDAKLAEAERELAEVAA
jgi:hypothetical protein